MLQFGQRVNALYQPPKNFQAFDKSSRVLYNAAVVIRHRSLRSGKGVITVLKIVLEILKKIVESVIARSIYDWFKSFFRDND